MKVRGYTRGVVDGSCQCIGVTVGLDLAYQSSGTLAPVWDKSTQFSTDQGITMLPAKLELRGCHAFW